MIFVFFVFCDRNVYSDTMMRVPRMHPKEPHAAFVSVLNTSLSGFKELQQNCTTAKKSAVKELISVSKYQTVVIVHDMVKKKPYFIFVSFIIVVVTGEK